MGPGTLGCDGKCYPKGMAGKEVDCMGVRPGLFHGVLRDVPGFCREILVGDAFAQVSQGPGGVFAGHGKFPHKSRNPASCCRSAEAPQRWIPAAFATATIRIW